MSRVKVYDRGVQQITTIQMIEVDRLMIEEYGISLLQMMENAGRCLSILAVKKFLKRKLNTKRVVVLAGTGGNGGGALVCARRLHNLGVKVIVYLSAEQERMTPVARLQLETIKRMGIRIKTADELGKVKPVALVIDGIIGYSIKGDPVGAAKKMIEWANAQLAPVLALDTPSGLDLTTGHVHQPTIQASATLTLALPKRGLFGKEARDVRGVLYLGNIGVPPELYAEPSLTTKVRHDLFAKGDVIKIDPNEIKGHKEEDAFISETDK